MAIPYPQVVLSDDLFEFWHNIRLKGIPSQDLEKAQNLFSFYKRHAINEEQYNRTFVPLDAALKVSLLKSPLKDILNFKGSLEALSLMTRLKFVLCENKCNYPYLNINGNGELIEPNFTGTFDKMPRTKCLEHLKALCKNANLILVCDKYLYSKNDGSPADCEQKSIERVKNVMCAINPSTTCNVEIYDFYYNNRPDRNEFNKSPFKKVIDEVRKQYALLQRKRFTGSFSKVHDRYMDIQSTCGTVRVILSSGFENLFDPDKDLTYIVRCL